MDNVRFAGDTKTQITAPYNSGMVNKASKGIATLNRPLTEQECEVLTWLLEHGVPGALDFVSQIPRLRVVGKCTCGCPTIYFAFDGVPVKRKGERVISDYIAEVDGHPIGLMVFQADGLLSSLEAYSLPGTDQPFGLPPTSIIGQAG